MTGILVVMAHPDDESFGIGGTLALYARRGRDIYLVCATGGEAGTIDPEYMHGFSSAAELRASELRCAAEQLGLKEVFMLGYRDSGMPGTSDNQNPDAQINHPLDEVAGRVVKYIRSTKPEIVITFDPIGGYRHPDHIHIHQATVQAFNESDNAAFHPEAGPPFKPRALLFQVFPRGFLKLLIRLMPLFGQDPRRTGRNRDIDLKALADVDFPIHAKIDIDAVRQVKMAAGACHASQGGTRLRRGLWGVVSRITGDHEYYMQAYPPVTGSPPVRTELFGL